ncbi:hypothetical protein D3C85_320390 [compost metagenome]
MFTLELCNIPVLCNSRTRVLKALLKLSCLPQLEEPVTTEKSAILIFVVPSNKTSSGTAQTVPGLFNVAIILN